MAKWNGFVAITALLAGLSGFGPGTLAQDEPPAEAPAAAEEQPQQGLKSRMNLFLAVGGGIASADDVNTSLVTDATRTSTGSISLDDQQHAIAAIGWKLPEGRGDFRLVFNGFKEDTYEYVGVGSATQLAPNLQINPSCSPAEIAGNPAFQVSPSDRCLYNWWSMSIRNGQYVAERTPPAWDLSLDANNNGLPDPSEVEVLDPMDPIDRFVKTPITDTLENQIQTVDAIYGREFGRRRFSSHWWGGIRYFKYQGQMLSSAWLNLSGQPGSGFTDGALLNLLNLSQDASGFGPTGSWEVDFNFFNKGLVLYVRGQAAFTFNSIEVDSGRIFTLVNDVATTGTFAAEGRINESRDKSSWQNTGEAGLRIALANGLQFELAYRLTGYLDVILMPLEITIPGIPAQISAGTLAIYGTQDYRLEGWFATAAFQF